MEIPLSCSSTHWGNTDGSEEERISLDVTGLEAAGGSVDIQGQWRCETAPWELQTERSSGAT